MKIKRILVTGACGYIGTHVIQELLRQGYEVVAADIRPQSNIEGVSYVQADIFRPGQDLYHLAGCPDTLIHLAWRDGFQHQSRRHITDLPLHMDFLQGMMEAGVKNISVMGSMHEIGYWEGAISETTPTNPLSNYGIAKNALRQIAQLLAKEYGVCLHWLRGFYIYGDDAMNHSVFSKILQAAGEGKKTFPFTSGKNLYDFLSVEELARQIVAVATQTEYAGIVQCCSGQPVSLGEMAERFIRDRGLSIRLDYGAFPDRPDDSPGVWGDTTALQKILYGRRTQE